MKQKSQNNYFFSKFGIFSRKSCKKSRNIVNFNVVKLKKGQERAAKIFFFEVSI